MEPGDRVIFSKDPLLYGVLRVGVKTADGRLVCEPCHPAVPVHRRKPEIFFIHELAVFTDPLVDVAAEAAKLEERDTQTAQDADADARARRDDTTGEVGGEGQGSE